MLEYYETTYAAAERLKKDEGWIRVMCEAKRIAPHVIKFEGKWFLPKDSWILPPKETAPVLDRIPGYCSRQETMERLGMSSTWVKDMLLQGRLKDKEGRVGVKLGGVWHVPLEAKIQPLEREYAWPKDKREQYAAWKRESRKRQKAKG